MDEENRRGALATRYLCTVEFEAGGGIIGIGASPFGDQRLGHVSGGRFFGHRINGIVLPGGGNWSRSGRLGGGASVGTFDARAVWQTGDGDLVYLSYTGRNIIPDDVRTSRGGARDDARGYEGTRQIYRPAPDARRKGVVEHVRRCEPCGGEGWLRVAATVSSRPEADLPLSSSPRT